MRLLIANFARRRNRGMAIYMFAAVAGLWWGAAEAGAAYLAFGISMGFTFAIGSDLTALAPRALWYLPVSKRDIWRANWVVATIGATSFTTAAKLLAFLVPDVRHTFALRDVALSSVFDFAYTGLGCAFLAVVTRPEPNRGLWRQPVLVLKGLAPAGLQMGMMGGMVLGGSFPGLPMSGVLPTHWSDLTARSVTILVAALGLTFATYFHTPVPMTPAIRAAGPRSDKIPQPRLKAAGLSGLPRLLVHEYAWTLLTGGGLLAGSLLVVLVAVGSVRSPHDAIEFGRTMLLRFDGMTMPQLAGGLDMFLMLIWYALFVTTLAARFPGVVRHLRVLPLSAAQMNALLVLWPLAIWIPAWAALVALHYLVLGRLVTTFHLPLLIGLLGASALVRALTLRVTGVLQMLTFVVAVGVVPFLSFLSPPPPSVLVPLGIIALGGAALLNGLSLRQNSTYRTSAVIVGFARGPAGR